MLVRNAGIDAVLVFDLDDTLYLEREYVESGLHAVGAWARCQLGIAGLGDMMVERFRAGARGHLFDDGLAAAGVGNASDLVPRMLQVYRQHRPCIHLAEDAERYLARRPARTGLALITDGYLDAQKRKIRALGLHNFGVQLAICTDRWGRESWKPAPRAFDYVQAFFGLSSTAFVYVADNADKDFHAPRQIGWRTIQISRPGRLHEKPSAMAIEADECIATLDSLKI